MRKLVSCTEAKASLWLNQSNAPIRYKPILMNIIAMRVAKKPEIASVDAPAETLINDINKYLKVYEKR